MDYPPMGPRAIRSVFFYPALCAFVLSAGCDAEPEAAKPKANDSADAKTQDDKPATKAASTEKGWSVTYSGSSSGTISGKISQITPAASGLYVVASNLEGNSMTVGLTVKPSDTGVRDAESFNITVDREVCEQVDGKPVKLDVTDGGNTSLAFTLSGTLQCEGKLGTVDVEGTFRKK